MSIILQAKKDWKKHHSKDDTSVSSMGWVGKQGQLAAQLHGPCHAQLCYVSQAHQYGKILSDSNLGRPRFGELISVFSGIQKNKAQVDDKPEVERTFIEWLLYHSPFKKAFIPSSTAETLEYRVLAGDAENVPANLVGAGLMATRTFNEHPYMLKTWWELVRNGVHPNVAWVFCHRIYVSDDGRVASIRPIHNGTFDSYLSGGYHDYNTDNQQTSYVLNFLQDLPKQLSGGNYNTHYGDSIYSHKIWAGDNKDAKGAPEPSKIHEILANVGKKSVSVNPFGKAKAMDNGGAPLLNDALETLVPFLNRYKEFF